MRWFYLLNVHNNQIRTLTEPHRTRIAKRRDKGITILWDTVKMCIVINIVLLFYAHASKPLRETMFFCMWQKFNLEKNSIICSCWQKKWLLPCLYLSKYFSFCSICAIPISKPFEHEKIIEKISTNEKIQSFRRYAKTKVNHFIAQFKQMHSLTVRSRLLNSKQHSFNIQKHTVDTRVQMRTHLKF